MTVLSVRNNPEVILEMTVKQNATFVLFLDSFSLHVFLSMLSSVRLDWNRTISSQKNQGQQETQRAESHLLSCSKPDPAKGRLSSQGRSDREARLL